MNKLTLQQAKLPLNTHLQMILRVFFTILCAIALFIFLYYEDNQYTQTATQPINGLLCISSEEFEHTPIRFLIRDWEYYPGELFTPQDFKSQAPNAYKKNVYIGEYTTLNAGIPYLPVHGSGTYRLTFKLPEGKRLYTFELPEIYSSYKLYINDELYLAMGNPDPAHYVPKVQNKTLTFSGEGIVTILLAVTDQSHLYSGMVHPIAFGQYEAITSYVGIKLFLKISILLISLGTALISLYFYFKIKMKQSLLFSLLCFTIMGYTSYFLLHMYFMTGIQPWYSIELFCCYAMLALLIALTNQICHIQGRFSKVMTYTSLAFSVIVLFYGLMSGMVTTPIHSFFSHLFDLIKWCAFVYVLGVCLLALKENVTHANALLLGLIFFGISLGADLILPLYEPIYTFQYNEIGGMVLALIIGSIIWNDLIEGYALHFEFVEANKQMQHQLDLQRKHYASLNAKIEETRTIRHDLRQHMRILNTLVEEQNIESLKNYFKTYHMTLSFETPLTFCNNYAADAILQYYDQLCKEKNIHYMASLTLPNKCSIPDTDLCIILGNLVENALEACLRDLQASSFIQVSSEIRSGTLLLLIKNTFNGTLQKHHDRLVSSKRDALGIGTYSVRSLVERYGGMITFEAEEKIFSVSILLPLIKSAE